MNGKNLHMVSLLLVLSSLVVFAAENESEDRVKPARDTASITTEIAVSPEQVSDHDSDGVPDSLDRCPNTPNMIIINSTGCPDTSRILARRIIPGLFPSGGSSLHFADPTQLDSIVVFLRVFDSLTAIIYGYTDNLGIDEANLKISQERADAVQRYFVAQGISEDRLLSIGEGETKPIADNRTRAGRRMNRRIEIQFRFPK